MSLISFIVIIAISIGLWPIVTLQHEFSHAAVAYLFGAKNIRFKFFPNADGGMAKTSCNWNIKNTDFAYGIFACIPQIVNVFIMSGIIILQLDNLFWLSLYLVNLVDYTFNSTSILKKEPNYLNDAWQTYRAFGLDLNLFRTYVIGMVAMYIVYFVLYFS